MEHVRFDGEDTVLYIFPSRDFLDDLTHCKFVYFFSLILLDFLSFHDGQPTLDEFILTIQRSYKHNHGFKEGA